MTMKHTPKWSSKPFKTENKVYPTITVELWNTTLREAVKWLKNGNPQRLQVGWPELSTMLEFMLVPLNNHWEELRMTGTGGEFDKKLEKQFKDLPKVFHYKSNPYTFVGIVGFGCYAFNLQHSQHVNYIMEKLGLNEPEATGTKLLFKILGEKLVLDS